MNTVRNCHSPAGMGYSLSGTHNTNLADCPICKQGTVINLGKKVFCQDCKREWSHKLYEKLRKIMS